jgi:hypothetical protein
MKIDITHIIWRHILTLKDGHSNKVSGQDILIFYIIPALISSATFLYTPTGIDKNIHSTSISVFAILIPLLLNIQVAIYSVFLRRWETVGDKKIAKIQDDMIVERNNLISELNINLSYLVIISTIALLFFTIAFTYGFIGEISIFVTFYVYIHFTLTFFMIVKRSFALFQKEYQVH